MGKPGGKHQPDGNSLAMRKMRIGGGKSMGKSMPQVQHPPPAFLIRVFFYYPHFHTDSRPDDLLQHGEVSMEYVSRISLDAGEKGGAGDDARFHYLCHTGLNFFLRKGKEKEGVNQNALREIEGSDGIDDRMEMDSIFPPHACIHLGKKGGGDEDEGKPP